MRSNRIDAIQHAVAGIMIQWFQGIAVEFEGTRSPSRISGDGRLDEPQ
jgi:hypothetical protein